jgi:DNA-directed RNA polymerase subunit N (RpoN/RPB10)
MRIRPKRGRLECGSSRALVGRQHRFLTAGFSFPEIAVRVCRRHVTREERRIAGRREEIRYQVGYLLMDLMMKSRLDGIAVKGYCCRKLLLSCSFALFSTGLPAMSGQDVAKTLPIATRFWNLSLRSSPRCNFRWW